MFTDEATADVPQRVAIAWLTCPISGLPRMSNAPPDASSCRASSAAMIGAALSEEDTIAEMSRPVVRAAIPVSARSKPSSNSGEKWKKLASSGPCCRSTAMTVKTKA